MKQKLWIALAAVLAISLLLAGCTAAPAAGETENGYGGRNRTAAAPAADELETGFGRRNETAPVLDESASLGAGYRGGNGSAGSGNSGECDPLYDGAATVDSDYVLTEADKTLSLTGYGSAGALSDDDPTLADMLTYAIQDEYLARAEYDLILNDFGSVRPFTNIIRAEETHIEALLPLFGTYGVEAPADEGASHTVTVESLAEAYPAGVNAEVNNIAMYEIFLEQSLPDDVRVVFESLLRASENHLRAFQNRL